MNELDFFVDAVDDGVCALRAWRVVLHGKTVAQHETLGAALAACVYLAEIELRRRPREALVTIAVRTAGSRVRFWCAPRDRTLPTTAERALPRRARA